MAVNAAVLIAAAMAAEAQMKVRACMCSVHCQRLVNGFATACTIQKSIRNHRKLNVKCELIESIRACCAFQRQLCVDHSVCCCCVSCILYQIGAMMIAVVVAADGSSVNTTTTTTINDMLLTITTVAVGVATHRRFQLTAQTAVMMVTLEGRSLL
jgi:hypothetical protein